MLDFMMNNKEYEIQANGQLSTILSQFDSNYVMDIIEDTLKHQLNTFDLTGPPNAVVAFETCFKELFEVYPNDQTNIQDSRIETYRTIIEHICRHMNMTFQEGENVDLYTIAYYLYDFFVSHLCNYIVTFYDRYIQEEKLNLYTNFRLEDLKKNKDMGSVYSKLAFGDDEVMATIVANLPIVLQNLRQMPISDETIYRRIYGAANEHVVQLLISNIFPQTSVFGIFNMILFNEHLYPTVVTHIRMAIQQTCRAELNAAAAIAAGGKA